ncbi:hypothetical protein LINGRAHAP2_LOCUS29507 [Linum grandiflorum]
MWHRPDRVLCQVSTDQPIPGMELHESKVIKLLGMTQRREVHVAERLRMYVEKWEGRFGYVAEPQQIVDPHRHHFHDQYMDWYRNYTGRRTSRRGAVHESAVRL